MKNINIFCFGFGQVAKNFIKKLIIEKYNITLTTTSRKKNLQKKTLMASATIVFYLMVTNLIIIC